jgi:gas vesicle protein
MTNKKGMSPVTAGLVGAAVGAAVGAGAMALSDEKNRKKIGKKFNEFKEGGQKVYSDIKEKVEELSSQGEAKVEEAKQAVKSKL